MKFISIIILIVLCLLTLSQVTIFYPHTGVKTSSIQTLNVCHSTNNGILKNTDIPFINEYFSKPISLRFSGTYESSDPTFNLIQIVFLKDHPPRF